MKKHKHDIKNYQKLRNDGLSWREIGQVVEIPAATIYQWVIHNYREVITYEKK